MMFHLHYGVGLTTFRHPNASGEPPSEAEVMDERRLEAFGSSALLNGEAFP
jgi:hypothetical protein